MINKYQINTWKFDIIYFQLHQMKLLMQCKNYKNNFVNGVKLKTEQFINRSQNAFLSRI